MRQTSKYAIAWTAALALFMAVLDSTIVNIALVPMSRAVNTDLSGIQWVISAYFLTQAAVIPVAGYFGLRFGLKRLFIICMVVFTLGSVLCGLTDNLGWLVAFRIIQGLGGGGLFPLAQAIALRAFPPQERATSSAIIGFSALVAPILGPTVGGLLTDSFGWESIFFINLPVGIVAIYLAWRNFPADNNAEKIQSRFDYLGLTLCISGVLLVVYAFTLVSETQPGTVTALQPRGEIWGWGYWLVWVLLGAGALLLAAFAVFELRFSRDPVLDLRLFKNYAFATSTVVTSAIAMVIFGSIFILPVFLEQIRLPHLSALEAGLILLPQGIASAVAVLLSGRVLYNRIGPRNLIIIGAVLLIIGTWGWTNLQPDTDGWSLLPWLVIRGLGFGLTFVPAQTRALQEITGLALAKASSLLNVVRQIFSSIGTAIATTIFLQQIAHYNAQLRAEALRTLPPGVTPNPNSPQIQQLVARAGTQAANDVFWITTIGAVLILLLAFTLPGRPKTPEPESEATTREPVAAFAE
jgi:EmrB/QacA subfamily drug resistance transporter